MSRNGLIVSDDFGHDRSVQDVFNLTLAAAKTSTSYNITGEIVYTGLVSVLENFVVDLASCNTSTESNKYLVSVTETWAPNIDGSNWTHPVVNLQFDSETANLTVEGYFFATPWLLNSMNSSTDLGPDSIQGRIKMTFLGIIDPYHSDQLVNNNAAPAWVRTVGFNNNALNIGYSSGGSHSWPHPQVWAVSVTSVLISVLLMCI